MKVSAFRKARAPGEEPAAEAAIGERAPDAPADGPAARDRSSARRSAGRDTRDATAESLSASAFRQLFADAASDFAHAGLGAAFGTTAGSRRAPGPTWISMVSPWAHGRLIRRADGSFDSEAYRIPSGELLRTEHGEYVRPHHLHQLIAAMAPQRDDVSLRSDREG